jgi:hypothetical protein
MPDNTPTYWRIEIKKYPKLALVGGKGNDHDPNAEVKYYTQKEIAEIVKYAQDRFVEVIPEIDMPGHESAANRAYPEYSGGGSEPHPEILCTGPSRWGDEFWQHTPGTPLHEPDASLLPGTAYLHCNSRSLYTQSPGPDRRTGRGCQRPGRSSRSSSLCDERRGFVCISV